MEKPLMTKVAIPYHSLPMEQQLLLALGEMTVMEIVQAIHASTAGTAQPGTN